MKNKKIIIIAGVIILIIIIILLIIFGKNKSISNTNIVDTQQTPIYQYSKLIDYVFFPQIDENNNIYYISGIGNFLYSFDAKTFSSSQTSDQEWPGANNIIYSPNKGKIIVQSDLEENNNMLFNIKDKISTPLDKNIILLSWSPDSQKIAYIYNGDPSQTINIADYNGKNWKKIADYDPSSAGFNNINWLNNNTVFYQSFVNSDKILLLYTYNINTGQTEKFDNIVDALVSTKYQKNIITKLENGKNNIYQTDNLFKNQKLVIGDKYINLSTAIWLNENAILYVDNETKSIYQLSLTDGKITNLITLGTDVTNSTNEGIADLMISSDNKTLYFTVDSVLYKVEI
jgi:hypothetical protein